MLTTFVSIRPLRALRQQHISPTLLSPRSPSSPHNCTIQTRTPLVGISRVYKMALLLVEDGIITVCVFFVFLLACLLSVGSYLVEPLSTSSQQTSRSPRHSPSMSLLPRFPFHGQQLYSRISVRDADEEVAEPLLPRRLKLGGEAPVSSIYLTAGRLSFLCMLGPGRPLLEATRWYDRGRHPWYFKYYKE